jgi:PncC family amidohydrolase
LYGEGEDDLAALVLDAARQRGVRLAVAESCTGGLIGARLTAVPGSSDVFDGGAITYADSAKSDLLGVDLALIAEHGAVSEPVVKAMAVGAGRRLGAVAVAVTGIAGPAGGSPEKPVGTVWLAVADGDDVRSSRIVTVGTRNEIRARAAQAALALLWRRLQEVRTAPSP